MKLKNKVSLILGGASGIGEAIAKLFAQEGSQVIVADFNIESGNRVCNEIIKNGGKAIFLQIDVTNENEVEKIVAAIEDKFGVFDIMVNTIGIYRRGIKVEDLSSKNWDELININLKGIFLSTKHAIKHFKKNKLNGLIINIASRLGLSTEEGSCAYCVSKAAVIMLTKVAALENVDSKIRINCIAPGRIDTPLLRKAFPDEKSWNEMVSRIPLKRAGKPGEVAKIALFLASDDASYVTGATYTIDGGFSAK